MKCDICQTPIEKGRTRCTSCEQCAELLRWFRGYLDVEDTSTITPDTSFQQLGCDSLDYMDWVLEAEEHFGIQLADRDADRIQTVRDYLKYLRDQGAAWPASKRIQLIRHGRYCPTYSWEVVEAKSSDVD